MANGHGGPRSGAGRKKKSTKERQMANRTIVLDTTTDDALRAAMLGQLEAAANGNPKAFAAIAPYLLGSPTQEIELSGANGGPIEVMLSDEARVDRIARLIDSIRTRTTGSAATAQPDLGATAGSAN